MPGLPKFIHAVLAAALAWVLAVGCSEQEPAPPAVQPVRTFVLQETVAVPFRRFPGEVKAAESSEMSFDVSGRLVELPATQGQVVTRGDLLARLDPENFQARLDSANARLKAAEDELARRSQLRERGVISQSELDRHREQFEVAEAARREARRALDDTRMLAPMDGRIARVLLNNFQSVQAKQPVLVFQDLQNLEVGIEIPETDMAQGGRGITPQTARDLLDALVEFPALPGQQFPLELQEFSTQASPTARTFHANFLLHPPADQNILPGMTCTVLLRLRSRLEAPAGADGIFEVPLQAVATAAGSGRIWLLDPDTMTVRAVEVELLAASGDSLQVRSELVGPGAEIVTTGVRFLSDGMAVRRMEERNR